MKTLLLSAFVITVMGYFIALALLYLLVFRKKGNVQNEFKTKELYSDNLKN